MSENPAQYFKKYRSSIGFSRQDDAERYLTGKDVTPKIDYKYIDELNKRIEGIIAKINAVADSSYKRSDLSKFAQDYIYAPYNIIKSNGLLPQLNNWGRRPESVLFSWLRGYTVMEYFTPAFSKIFGVELSSITQIGDDDLKHIETFRQSPKADLEIKKNEKSIRIEVQSGFQRLHDIKKQKVEEARRVYEDTQSRTICVHIDLYNGQVAFVQLDTIQESDVEWKRRGQMESQYVFSIDQSYFKWRLLDEIPVFADLELEL